MSRVDELVRLMTWDEKLAQMQVVFKPDPAQIERWVRAGVGAVFWPRSAAAVNALQRVAVEQMIRGYQGDDLRQPGRIAATAKHFVGYGHAEGGRDYNTADISEHRLRNVYLEPFRAATAAGVASVMAAFNTIGGKPMHAHRRLLTDVLKDEWGIAGVIVGDADGVGNLVPHGVAEDLLDAVRQSVQAGLDVEMGGSLTDADGHALLTPEQLPEDRVDDAVRRILRLKARLGPFDKPYVAEDQEITEPTTQARAQVRAAAIRSTVLLKNDGTLPVAAKDRILLTGPYATSTDHLGASFGHGGGYTTFRHANTRLSAPRLPLAALESGEQVEVSVDVSNTGDRDGDEVVQLYVRDLVSSVAQPVRRLIAFARRHISADQTITVSFRLGMEQLGFWDTEANPVRFVVEPGTFGLYIGASLRATQELTFEVL